MEKCQHLFRAGRLVGHTRTLPPERRPPARQVLSFLRNAPDRRSALHCCHRSRRQCADAPRLVGRARTHAPFFLPLLLPPCGKERAGVRRPMFTSTNPSPPALSPFGRGEGVISVRCVCQNARAACFETRNQTISSVAPSWAGNN